ncbi:MAG: right-handed parallel beta-helix repeat-containing protein [Anaerolineae bacterium]
MSASTSGLSTGVTLSPVVDPDPSYRVGVFYYPWYGTPAVIPPCPDFVDPVGVGVEDILAIAGHWGEQSGDEGWDPRFDLDRNQRVDAIDIMSVVAALGSTCPAQSCIPSGDQNSINNALTDVGSAAILCQNAVFELTGPVVFTHDKQAVYTEGFPTGSSRALLRVVDQSVTVAVNLEDRSDAVLSHVIVDGNRPHLGPADGGEALIQAGGAVSGQVIEWVKAYEPTWWSILHVFEGPGLSCSGVQIRHNDFGPAGQPDGTWADGISLACRNSVVTDNTITDATDGAIVIFGAPGSLIENNTIRAETRVLLGGIHMVAYNPFEGDYTGVRVTGNTIDAAGQHIKIGVAIGERVWGCLDPNEPDLPPDPVLRGGSVTGNTLMGDNMRYGFAVDGVEDWTVMGNIDLSTHSGVPIHECHGQIPSPPAGFQFHSQRAAGTFQPEFEEAYVEGALWAIDP